MVGVDGLRVHLIPVEILADNREALPGTCTEVPVPRYLVELVAISSRKIRSMYRVQYGTRVCYGTRVQYPVYIILLPTRVSKSTQCRARLDLVALIASS